MKTVRLTRADVFKRRELPISVRAGGHGVNGFAVCDDGLMIDVSRLKGIRVDPEKQTVRAQAGLTWGEFDAETQAFGLATTGGRVTTTGIAGLTLGSGNGWLERLHGYTADNLLRADVVTADGKLVTASDSENSDLFWGIRGGGGNFGVVTEFEFRLHPVGPMLFGGMLLWPADDAREVVSDWVREWGRKIEPFNRRASSSTSRRTPATSGFGRRSATTSTRGSSR